MLFVKLIMFEQRLLRWKRQCRKQLARVPLGVERMNSRWPVTRPRGVRGTNIRNGDNCYARAVLPGDGGRHHMFSTSVCCTDTGAVPVAGNNRSIVSGSFFDLALSQIIQGRAILSFRLRVEAPDASCI